MANRMNTLTFVELALTYNNYSNGNVENIFKVEVVLRIRAYTSIIQVEVHPYLITLWTCFAGIIFGTRKKNILHLSKANMFSSV